MGSVNVDAVASRPMTEEAGLTTPDGPSQTESVMVEESVKRTQIEHWKFKICCMYATFIMLGFSVGILGPTLVDLEEQYGIDTRTVSVVFTGSGVGYLAGSLLCGLVYDFFNYEAQFTLAVVLMGVTCAFAPWTGNFVGFVVLNGIQNIGSGFIDAAGQAYLLYVLAGHRLQEPVLQGAHAAWSLGASIVPFLVQPFLREKAMTESYGTNVTTQSVYQTTAYFIINGTVLPTLSSQVNHTEEYRPKSIVKYGYLMIGLIITGFSLMYFFAWCIGDKFCMHRRKSNKRRTDEKSSERGTLFYQVGCLTILFCWFFTQVWIELGLGNFVSPYAIKELNWTKTKASWIASALWAGQCVGRVLSVPVALFLTPRTMVCISVTGTAIASIVMLLLIKVSDVFYWLGVILAGLTMSSSFGSMVLWSSRHISVTGVASSVFLVGASTGGLVGPLLIGQMFDLYSPMAMVYVTVAAALCQVLFVLVFAVFVRFCGESSRSDENGGAEIVGEEGLQVLNETTQSNLRE